MHKFIPKYLCLLVAVSTFLSCSHRSADDNPADEVVYTPAYIQKTGASDYQEAMRLAEQARQKGYLSDFKTYELQANLTYQFTEDYKAAASYLNMALSMEEANDPDTRTDLLYHLATIHRTAKEFLPCIEACTEGKEVAHSIGRIYDMYAFDFLAGSCIWNIGKEDEGTQMMKDAIAGATSVADSEAQYGHLAYFNGKLISALIEVQEYDSALQQCSQYEQVLNTMQKKYPGTSELFQDRSRFYLSMDQAVSYAGIGNKVKASDAFSDACERQFAKTEGGALRQTFYYAAIGDPDNVLRIYAEYPYSNPDTVSRDYRGRLARIRDAYHNAGMEKEYAMALERYNKLDTLLEARERAEGIQEMAQKYDSQHYRLALSDSLKALRNNRLLFSAMILLVIAALIVFLVFNRRYYRQKEEQHRKDTSALEKDIRALRKQVSLIAEKNFRSSPNLVQLVEGDQLYLNKNLNRDSAAALLGITQAEITRMLHEIQPDLSFPDYIKGLRLRHAIKLLSQNPDIPISELADQCGFYSVRTFQRSFLTLTGKTPSEYAKDLKTK